MEHNLKGAGYIFSLPAIRSSCQINSQSCAMTRATGRSTYQEEPVTFEPLAKLSVVNGQILNSHPADANHSYLNEFTTVLSSFLSNHRGNRKLGAKGFKTQPFRRVFMMDLQSGFVIQSPASTVPPSIPRCQTSNVSSPWRDLVHAPSGRQSHP
jgi:hypothetical protein